MRLTQVSDVVMLVALPEVLPPKFSSSAQKHQVEVEHLRPSQSGTWCTNTACWCNKCHCHLSACKQSDGFLFTVKLWPISAGCYCSTIAAGLACSAVAHRSSVPLNMHSVLHSVEQGISQCEVQFAPTPRRVQSCMVGLPDVGQ